MVYLLCRKSLKSLDKNNHNVSHKKDTVKNQFGFVIGPRVLQSSRNFLFAELQGGKLIKLIGACLNWCFEYDLHVCGHWAFDKSISMHPCGSKYFRWKIWLQLCTMLKCLLFQPLLGDLWVHLQLPNSRGTRNYRSPIRHHFQLLLPPITYLPRNSLSTTNTLAYSIWEEIHRRNRRNRWGGPKGDGEGKEGEREERKRGEEREARQTWKEREGSHRAVKTLLFFYAFVFTILGLSNLLW